MASDSDQNIVVIGASAGGIPILQRIFSALPADLDAAIFVVLHVPPWHRSELPGVINSISRLHALHPSTGERIEHGHIYVAPPDHHLLIEPGRVELWRGPKENRHRPAINVTFRSAAVSYRERVIGIILSGALDDGATWLWWIQKLGGVTIVMDPREAEFPDMPCAALEHVRVDYVAGVSQIPPLLSRLTSFNGGVKVDGRRRLDTSQEAH